LFSPVLAPGADAVVALAGLCRVCRGHGVVRLDALPAEWAGLSALLAAARAAWVVPLGFDHFGNWYEDVAGLGWAGYLAARAGALRETIRRRLRQAERLADASFTLLTRPDEMDQAVAAFETVYARSWKDPEPFPTFNAALIRMASAHGVLRFGLWSVGGKAVAVQVWVVQAGCATVLKLAHDEAYKAHSPGTVLTALMLRHLLDRDGVRQIDFGRGDDGYKRGWATRRRQRIGILLVNPLCLSGAMALGRHAAGRVIGWLRAKRGG
jgi:CelD/BcsL family acetyltransferase involved in cellulose biosynthesis